MAPLKSSHGSHCRPVLNAGVGCKKYIKYLRITGQTEITLLLTPSAMEAKEHDGDDRVTRQGQKLSYQIDQLLRNQLAPRSPPRILIASRHSVPAILRETTPYKPVPSPVLNQMKKQIPTNNNVTFLTLRILLGPAKNSSVLTLSGAMPDDHICLLVILLPWLASGGLMKKDLLSDLYTSE
ncbi:hypothetical protein BJY01DRAFT_216114 [Aspergillus pseudoustus]|uniref:Uncharacterized protein n=1 Tax=Aspergillus pseudoustus TaxID=1810923 RepID=A0ABR4JT13_9EURO